MEENIKFLPESWTFAVSGRYGEPSRMDTNYAVKKLGISIL